MKQVIKSSNELQLTFPSELLINEFLFLKEIDHCHQQLVEEINFEFCFIGENS